MPWPFLLEKGPGWASATLPSGPCCWPTPALLAFTGGDWTGQLGRAGSSMLGVIRTVKREDSTCPGPQEAEDTGVCSLIPCSKSR